MMDKEALQRTVRILTDALAQQIDTSTTDWIGRELIKQEDRRFYALRNLSLYRGPIDQDGYPE